MKPMREIDVRGLEPPEPFVKIMDALQTLPAETELLVNIHREPYPLYEVLRNTGYIWQTKMLADDNYRIVIAKTA